MKRFLIIAMLACASLPAQPSQSETQAEQDSLRQALGEAGNSPVDFERALENHLNKFPNSPRRLELERALVKAATDLKDDSRIIKYGERVLEHDPDDAQILERVSTALIRNGNKPSAERALKYIKHFEELLQSAVSDKPASPREQVKFRDAADRSKAKALLLESHANGILEHLDKAANLAELSFAAYPSVEAARESSRWLAAQGNKEAAIQYLAKAFTIAELKAPDPDAAQDRIRMGELYKEWKGSEAGLGDLVLKAYDQTSAAFEARHEAMKQMDPNSGVKEPLDFTITGVEGDKLRLASLKGKVIVMDFWATWCGPCRIQHPLYEQTKQQFKNRDDVIFLAIDTDEDRTAVKPFLEQNNWSKKVYFEDGLGVALQISSIPTTVIFDKKGQVSSRMNGFLPERFVDMLTDRIRQALGEPGPATVASRAARP
jgi:thiol-disulfide isomerase/thioredoxin